MKTKYYLLSLFAFIMVLNTGKLFGWGADVIVSQAAPFSQHSISAKQNGVLFAGVPVALVTGQHSVAIYTSTDNGVTWTLAPVTAPASINPVIKTKMITTTFDNVFCYILQDNVIYVLNVESGVTGQFNTTGAQEFDVASGSGNFAYLFVQEPGLNTIKRYGTNDGGQTWTGNTATVTSNGSRPRVHMFGARLILNYYGPVLSDTVSSVIRAAFYNETAAGTITPGTFSDVATNNTIKKKLFQSVMNNGLIWFFFTEGDAQQVLKCRVSTDNGATYQPEFIVSGDAQVNAHWFSAAPMNNSGTFGAALTFLADSIAPSGTSLDQMKYATAMSGTPASFVIPASPLDTYNDTTVSAGSTNTIPVLINYTYGMPGESGILWVGENAVGQVLYFDRFTATTGIRNEINENIALQIYPSPATDLIQVAVSIDDIELSEIEVYSIGNKLVLHKQLSKSGFETNQPFTLDISALASGTYLLKAITSRGAAVKQFVILK
jgi:hypothetical protein